MPAVWNDDEFVSGGLKGINKFQGQLTEIEEDVSGKFGEQLALYFDECEVLESAEEVSLEGGKYTDWIKQTNKKNSVNQAFVEGITKFIKAQKLKGGVPDALYGLDIIWERTVVIEGDESEGMSPGLCLLPIALASEVEEAKPAGRKGRAAAPVASDDEEETEEAPAPPKRQRRSRAAATEPPPSDDDESDIPADLVAFILTRVTEDGVTQEIIRRDIAKKLAMKKLRDSVDGGLETILAHMVESEALTEDEGTYFLPEE